MSPLVMGTVAVVALFFSGLFNTIEAALAVSSKARVAQIAKEKSTRAARRLLIVLDHRAEHINLLILGQKLLDATAAVFTAMLAMEWLSPRIEWALVAAIGGVTLLSFVIVGVFSRTIGRQNPYTVSLVAAFFLRPTFRILNPISKVLIGIGNILAPGRGFQDGPYSTEVELIVAWCKTCLTIPTAMLEKSWCPAPTWCGSNRGNSHPKRSTCASNPGIPASP